MLQKVRDILLVIVLSIGILIGIYGLFQFLYLKYFTNISVSEIKESYLLNHGFPGDSITFEKFKNSKYYPLMMNTKDKDSVRIYVSQFFTSDEYKKDSSKKY